MAEQEHDRWMRMKSRAGWPWAEKTDKPRCRHQDLRPWEPLSHAELSHDELTGRYSPVELEAMGLARGLDDEAKLDDSAKKKIESDSREPGLLAESGYALLRADSTDDEQSGRD